MSEPAGLDAFLKEPIEKAMPTPPAPAAVPHGTAEPHGLDEFLQSEQEKKEFGTLPQQALTAVEGAGRGATVGLSDELLKATGTDPERIKARMRVNPTLSGLSTIGGGAALIGGTGGVAAPIEEALGGSRAATAIGYGTEGAILGAGQAVTDHALGDPDLNAQKVLSEMGIGSLFGIGAGVAARSLKSLIGKSGRIEGSVSNEIENVSAENSLKSESENTLSDGGFKKNAPEIIEAGKELGAPVTEGMVSSDPWVQKAEDALVNGAPTYSGIQKSRLYEQGYDAVKKTLTNIVGEPEAEGGLTKAQLGQSLEQSLTSKISQAEKPIGDLYNEIREHTTEVPVSPRSLPRIVKNIEELDAVRIDPDGAAGQLARRMSKNIENIKSVDDVKSLRKVMQDALPAVASPGEKYVISEISDRLKELEKNTVTRYAEELSSAHETRLAKIPAAQRAEEQAIWGPKIAALKDLTNKMKAADRLYAPFIEKVKTLSKMLGKNRVSGAQGAINFITQDISPEQIAQRAFQKGNSEMATYFAKEFPEEWELVKQYQKGLLRDDAVMDRTGKFNPRAFIKNVEKLEPEIKKLLFTPDELKKLNAAKTYLRSIPETFNPSGTSGMSAFREFFHNPTGAAIANARDFGIDAYIKAVSSMPPGVRPNPLETGHILAQKFNQFNAVRNVAEQTEMKMDKGAKAIFYGNSFRGAVETAGGELGHSYNERVTRINELANNVDALGQHLSNHVDGLSGSMPNFSQSVQNAMLASIQYLNSKIPRPKSRFMGSGEWIPANSQKQEFTKYFDAVNDPLSLLEHVKNGSVTHEALEAVQSTHPELLKEMRTKVLSQMTPEAMSKIPYSVKMSLAKFLGEPLDSSMLPKVIISNQMAMSAPSPNGPSEQTGKTSQKGLEKLDLSNRAATSTQELEEPGGK